MRPAGDGRGRGLLQGMRRAARGHGVVQPRYKLASVGRVAAERRARPRAFLQRPSRERDCVVRGRSISVDECDAHRVYPLHHMCVQRSAFRRYT